MAISTQLYSEKFPYIHSRLYLFQDQVNENPLLNTIPRGEDIFADKKAQVERVANALRKATADFLGCSSDTNAIIRASADLSKDVFSNSYVKAATRALRSPEFEAALMKKRTYRAGDFLNAGQQKKIANLLEEEVTKDTMIDEDVIVNAVLNEFDRIKDVEITDNGKMSAVARQKALISNSMKGFKKSFLDQLSHSIQRVNKNDGLKKKVRQILREQVDKKTDTSQMSFDGIWAIFRKKFMAFYNEEAHVDNSANAYLEALKPKFEATIKNNPNKFVDVSNIRGTEEFLADIISTTSDDSGNVFIDATISLETIGSKSANDFYQSQASTIGMSKTKDLLNQVQNTFYDPTKNFIADYVIVNKKGEGAKRARVQSKNYVEYIKKWVSGSNANFSMKTGLGDNLSWMSFLDKILNSSYGNELYSLGKISEEETRRASYLLANALWFTVAGDYSFRPKIDQKTGLAHQVDKRKRTGQGSEGGVAGILRTIDLFVGNLIFGYLGLVNYEGIDEDNIQVIAETNNLFLLIGNQLLYPIAAVLDAFLEQFDEVITSIQDRTVHAKVGIKGGLGGAEEVKNYYFGKANKLGEPFGAATYENKNLVSFGREKGKEVLGLTRIEDVSISISIQDILRSSYQFIF